MDLVLLGFGDHTLEDLVSGAEKSREGLRTLVSIGMTKGNPPHWRSATSSSMAQKETFRKYLDFMADFIAEAEEGEEDGTRIRAQSDTV